MCTVPCDLAVLLSFQKTYNLYSVQCACSLYCQLENCGNDFIFYSKPDIPPESSFIPEDCVSGSLSQVIEDNLLPDSILYCIWGR